MSSRSKKAAVFGYFAAFLILGLTISIMGPTLPNLAAQTKTSISQISFLFSARSLGFLLGALFGGKIYDRLPGHPLIAAGLALTALSLFLIPTMSLFWMLLGLLFLLGLAEANIDVGTNTLLPWLYRDQVSPYMNGLHFFFGLGAFLSPIIVAQTMLHTGGFRAAYWLPALLIMPLMVLLLRLPSPPPAEQEMGETAVAPPRYLAIILVILFLFLYVGVEASFGGWIFVYATELGLATATNAAYLTSAFWGSLTVGRLISIPLAARLRPRQVIAVALIGGLLSLSFIIGWRESSAALLIGVIGFGLAIAPIFPATLSLTDRNMSISGQITGWFFAGGSIGAMIWPVVMGQLIKFVSPYAIMLAMLILMLLAALVYALFLRELARFRPREDDPQTRFL